MIQWIHMENLYATSAKAMEILQFCYMLNVLVDFLTIPKW